MYINIKYVIIRNFNSIGNAPLKFEFTEGLNGVFGENGSGKTTAFESLCFVLFGQPYRDVKIESLINRFNKKNLFVETEFEIGQDTYKIQRGLKPNILKVWKNEVEQNYLSSKRLIQNDIDDILGINIVLFKQILSFSSTYNKSFLTLRPKDKRKIIETIFNIRVFGIMSKMAKLNYSQNKIDFDQLTKIIKLNETNVNGAQKLVDLIKKQKANFESDKSTRILEIDKANIEYKNKVELLKVDIDKLEKELIEKNTLYDNIKDYDKELVSVSSKISVLKSDIERFKNEKKFFNENEICPTCHTSMDIEHKNSHLDKISSEIASSTEKLETLIKERIKLKEEIEKQKKLGLEISKLEKAINDLTHTSNNLKDKINSNILLIENERNKVSDIDSIEEAEEELLKNQNELKENSERYKDIDEKNVIVKHCIDILSDTGIKSYFFKKLLPILNSKINSYITHYELPLTLTFDEYLEEKITHVLFKNEEVQFNAFSEGEKKRIDSSLMFAFYDTIKFISNWNCNILILDEVLDGAVDDISLAKSFEILKRYTIADEKLCIYTITHRGQELRFDKQYHFKKKKNFTEYEIIGTTL